MKDLREEAGRIGITLTEEQEDAFRQYYEMLIEKNKVMNLTAITAWDDVVEKHFTDSLMIAAEMPDLFRNGGAGLSLMDVGTGAGFPGIPLKIVFPDLSVTLLDSLNKRVLFLQDVISALSLEGIQAVHARAEEGARNPELREHFDLCFSRAVAKTRVLSEYCLPFVRVGGTWVAYKSGDIREELQEASRSIRLLGGRKEALRKFTLPDSDIQRSLIAVKKIKPTPGAYPRKAGTASRNPL